MNRRPPSLSTDDTSADGGSAPLHSQVAGNARTSPTITSQGLASHLIANWNHVLLWLHAVTILTNTLQLEAGNRQTPFVHWKPSTSL